MNQTTQSTCGCCAGIHVLTPADTANRPGLTRLKYRAGTYADFFESMRARLSGKSDPALADLKTRAPDDASIALLDAWAVVADVLTFYQERIANEGFLTTATERRSILELARLVGYKLRPGVASTVYLAYEIEKDAAPVELAPGERANSVPGPGEQMQPFEIVDPLLARWEWNLLKPRLARPQSFQGFSEKNAEAEIYFSGIFTGLKPNDRLLFDAGNGSEPVAYHVREVVPLPAADPITGTDRTRVVIDSPEPEPIPVVERELRERAKKIVTHYRNLEHFQVSPDSEMAGLVVGLLDRIAESVEKKTSTSQLFSDLRTRILPQLREQLSIARKGTYRRLKPWLDALVQELETDVLAIAEREGLTTGVAQAVQRGMSSGERLQTILGDLGKPPSIPPVNATRLPRDLDKSFAPDSDNLPRLISTLEPSVAPGLYTAWKNIPVAPVDPTAIHAFRQKAAPFGYNAPLRPVIDDSGKVIGQEEWPLNGEVISTIEVFFRESRLRVTGSWGEELYDLVVDLSSELTQQWDKFTTITITPGISNGFLESVEVAFTNNLEMHSVKIKNGDERVSIELKDGSAFTLMRNETIQQRLGARTLAIEWALREALDTTVVAISVTTRQPPAPRNILPLDAAYEQIVPGTWVLIERADENRPYPWLVARVNSVQTVAKADYGLTGKSTLLTLDKDWLIEKDLLLSIFRATTVHVLSEELLLAEEPMAEPVCGTEIELDGLYDGLEAGRWLIFAGERSVTNLDGTVVTNVPAAERVMVAGVRQEVSRDNANPLPGDRTHTFLQLSDKLAYCYRRNTLRIYGNVVKATHGETRKEILGSGDASRALQQFPLRQPPLTHVSSSKPEGATSTLRAFVNDVEWHEADNLMELGHEERKFLTRTDDESRTTVVFGGYSRRGARLSTGLENVRAIYRNGIGAAGNVKAGQISLLATRPLGVKGVLNPLPATGGANREHRDQARRNAPLAVMAFDRLVSTSDYADFARRFAGIGKAEAARFSDGRREIVQVTVAGADDIPIEETSELYNNLLAALRQYGDPQLPVKLALRERGVLFLATQVRLLPGYQWEAVQPSLRAALFTAFSFQSIELGQDLLQSDAVRIMQATQGVDYVAVDRFDVAGLLKGAPAALLLDTAELKSKPRIAILGGRYEDGQIRPAQHAYLIQEVPDTLILQEWKL